MNQGDEKTFDSLLDKMLVDSSPEIRRLIDSQRAEIKKAVDITRAGIKATDDFLKQRLGPLYPFVVPQGEEIPLLPIRPLLKSEEKLEISHHHDFCEPYQPKWCCDCGIATDRRVIIRPRSYVEYIDKQTIIVGPCMIRSPSTRPLVVVFSDASGKGDYSYNLRRKPRTWIHELDKRIIDKYAKYLKLYMRE